MVELIKIETNEEGKRAVGARDLHEGLEVKTRFDIWFDRMCEYGFEENQDFILVVQKCTTNNPKNPTTERKDYAITLDMAKEISMIQRNEVGKKFRQYFIECEKELNKAKYKQKKLTREDELALLIINGRADATELLEYKEIVKLKAINGNNLILTCSQVVEQLKYNVPGLNTTIFHEWLSLSMGLGVYSKFGKDKRRTFQPNEKYIEFIAGEGYAVTGETKSSKKITMYYTSHMVSRIVKHHMGSLIEFTNAKMIA